MGNYIFAVVFLSLQQDLPAVDFVQQVFPLAHFFDFFLPVSASATPVTSKAAEINKNTFFIIICLINHCKCNADRGNCQPLTVKKAPVRRTPWIRWRRSAHNVAITVTPP